MIICLTEIKKDAQPTSLTLLLSAHNFVKAAIQLFCLKKRNRYAQSRYFPLLRLCRTYRFSPPRKIIDTASTYTSPIGFDEKNLASINFTKPKSPLLKVFHKKTCSG